MNIKEKDIINIVARIVQEQEERLEKGDSREFNRKRKPMREPSREPISSAGAAPGHHLFAKCTTGSASLTSQPGMTIAFFIEDGPGWNGSGGPGSGNLGYDSWANSQTILNMASGSITPGNVYTINIDGNYLGCHQYLGTSSTSFIPSFWGSTTDSNGNPVPVNVSLGTNTIPFNSCTSCVYGSTDPGGPDEPWEYDAEDMAEVRKRAKNLLRDFS